MDITDCLHTVFATIQMYLLFLSPSQWLLPHPAVSRQHAGCSPHLPQLQLHHWKVQETSVISTGLFLLRGGYIRIYMYFLMILHVHFETPIYSLCVRVVIIRDFLPRV